MKSIRTLRLSHFVTMALLAAVLVGACTLSASAGPSVPDEIGKLYNSGHYDQAVEALQAAVGKDPRDASLHFWLGRCFFELRDFERAISSLEKAVAIDPDNSDYHLWLGRACGRRAEESNPFSSFALARRTGHEFQTAVRLNQSNLAAQRDLIRFFLFAPGFLGGGDEHALEQTAALALQDSVQADLARAEYFTARKKFDQAAEQYQKILQAKPAAGVYLEIANYYRDQGDAQTMQGVVDAAAKAAPSDPRLDYYRGVAMVMGKSDPAEAEKDLRAYLAGPASSEFPSHASAHEWLGKLYESQGKLDQAASEYQAGVSLDPRNKGLHDDLKRVQHK
jgi:tetratricopeptide (TPR) repeat protein